jgi:hypothetical protein
VSKRIKKQPKTPQNQANDATKMDAPGHFKIPYALRPSKPATTGADHRPTFNWQPTPADIG